MKRYAWLLLAVLPVGLAAYLLRTSPTLTPAQASDGEVPDNQIPALLAEAISVRNSKALTTSDANVPGSAGPAAQAAAQDPALVEQNEILAIDAYAAEEHQKINAWYTSELVGLRTLLEQRMKRVNSKEMPTWTTFYEWINEIWFTPPDGDKCTWLHNPEAPQPRGVSRPGAYVPENRTKSYATTLRYLKYSWRTEPGSFEIGQWKLALLRKEKLAQLQNEVAKRKTAAAQKKLRAQAELARKLAGDPTPYVESTAATADNQFRAWIEGALVREGNTVQGYRVQKIRADSVEFEKDGRVYVQKVN